MKQLRYCTECKIYTLDKICGKEHETIVPQPPKFSPEDRYAKYRRIAKKQQGLL
jgi:H/ACA ribonucleoprotein complex subunit 3